MMARAMKTTGLEPGLTDSEISSLLGAYTDGTSASNYAKGKYRSLLEDRNCFRYGGQYHSAEEQCNTCRGCRDGSKAAAKIETDISIEM